ncbi:tail fiber assembly protein [Escherichia coli]|uniref:tail fiber assembly protein n=1 Tax=Escherichia coli TaxID=562 RepID=UPI00124A2C83|nr:tail fiber assembly protein [Escherichia coli]EFM9905924.1 tail fiber assembly protein [Escherichia coli]EFO0740017.1 tail fiber assembly protein [Escherichia coli]EGJ7468279.1 tail fiber assembly protein [Escherichia coli]EID2810211.1 tail fiber assembly protein [Escherichia coli]EIH3785354.1 tail fiber assembly protein [Escherichia coli]
MAKATLNKNGIAIKAGEIMVYNFDGATFEFISESVEFLAIGVGIPANSCTDAPVKAKQGYAVCRNIILNEWEYAVDHRGEVVFDTATGQQVEITTPGDYEDNLTTIAPATPYDRWTGSEWLTDESLLKTAQQKESEEYKQALLLTARNIISLWQTELQLGSISDEDKASLIAWLNYIKALNMVDTSFAPAIVWPLPPQA